MNAFRIAFDSIWSHRTRSALTALGIVIGVFAVVTLVSLGTAVRDFVSGQFRSVGASIFTISPASPGNGSPGEGHPFHGGGPSPFGAGGVPSTLTVGDSAAIAAVKSPSIRRVAPVSQLPLPVSTGSGELAAVAVIGTTASYFPMQQLSFVRGGFTGRGVALGASAAKTLFGDTRNPIGREVQVGSARLRVTGVLRKGEGMLSLQANQSVFMPVSQGLSLAGLDKVSQIMVEASGNSQVDAAAAAKTRVLDHRHALRDFQVMKNSQLLTSINRTLAVITAFLSGLAAISLIVGGIGIMNIMLVTVTERFREIGIRKALGARDGDILWQFLAEAMVLSLLGGLVGVVLSAFAGRIISHLAGLPSGLTPGAVLLAIAFSLAVGAVFGVLPALRASRLMPAEALRSE